MNKNFKKVMDLISEMKQSFSNQLSKFEQAALIDGTIVEFEVLEIGQAVFVVTETETIPAPEGTHELSGELEGVSIVVDANGIILEIIDERISKDEAPIVEEASEEKMSSKKVEQIVNAKLQSFAKSIEAVAEMMKVIAEQNKNLSNEVDTLKGQFESFKSQPTNSISESEKFAKVGNLTAKQNWLKNNKNI
jgi:hypothetical protein